MADRLVRATAADGGIRVVGAMTTRLTERPESWVNFQIKDNGPLGGVVVDAGLDGRVRGYVGNATIAGTRRYNGVDNLSGKVGKLISGRIGDRAIASLRDGFRLL